MPKPPRWVRETVLDILDAVSPAPVLALPWIVLAFLILPLIAEQRWTIV